MAKRGRKPKVTSESTPVPSDVPYFSEEQEWAVREFLKSTDDEFRNKTYNQYLKGPLEKMTESIINRYKLYSYKIAYKELFYDTLSFLHTKIYMFDPERGKKSYSYFGTIIKRRLQNNLKKESKDRTKTIFFEDVYRSVTGGDDIPEEEYNENSTLLQFFHIIVEDIKELLETADMKSTDAKVGMAIVEIAENWNSLYEEDTNKFKKNFILECIRNMTLLTTPEISTSLKFYKTFYQKRKRQFIKDQDEEDDFLD